MSQNLLKSAHAIRLASYQFMQQTRRFDEQAVFLQRTGQLGTFPACTGQEALFVASALALDEHDVYCPYYRDQGALLVRGVSPLSLLNYWGGYHGAALSTTYPDDLPLCVPIATQCTHAAGIAYSKQYREQPGIVLCSLGDGATAKGDFYEALNFSALYQLPIIFHINNNQWAISTPVSKQSATPLHQKADGFGLANFQIDGNDPVQVFQTIQAAKQQAPCVVESISHRLSDHTTADDASRYRCQASWQQAKTNDPVPIIRAQLIKAGEAETITLIEQQNERLITQAVTDYQNQSCDTPSFEVFSDE